MVWEDYLKKKHVCCMTVRVGSAGEDCLKYGNTTKIQAFVCLFASFDLFNATFRFKDDLMRPSYLPFTNQNHTLQFGVCVQSIAHSELNRVGVTAVCRPSGRYASLVAGVALVHIAEVS